MCSFRPLADVVAHLRAIPALAALCGGEPAIQRAEQATGPDTKKALRSLFESLMTSSESHVADSLHGTVLSLKKANTSDADDLFLRLVDYYPADVGCFAAYLLNHIHIKPGEAFFMAANEPHAYLKGQCVEIMAASDNVVRAGLTPKFKDVSTLVDMLTYVDAPPVIMQGNPIDDFSTVYQPPAEEFQVTKYCIPQGVRHQLPPAKGPGIILCIAGSGTLALDVDAPQPDNSPLPLQPGAIFYIPDSQPLLVSVHMSSDPSQQLFFFRAGINQSCVH